MPKVKIREIEFGGSDLPLIAGPCVIESRDHSLFMAEKIQEISAKYNIPFIYKSSFDKANRTSIGSFRGLGVDGGLEILAEVKKRFDIPILTDIHLPEQADMVSQVADILQIPAFLCRQTDLLLAAGNTGVAVNVKKGQFLAPEKMKQIVKKLESTGNKKILLTERGTTFGYSMLINDLRAIPIMQETGYPVIYDGTHSAQMPGGGGEKTAGKREFIPVMVKAAVAAGCNGLFLEVHDNVAKAPSDSETQWPLNKLDELLKQVSKIREAIL